MSVKTSGLEFKAFYKDEDFWPEGSWHDGELVSVNGVEKDPYDVDYADMPDSAVITFTGGAVFDADGKDMGSFEGRLKKWRKQQSEVVITVSVPKAKEEAVRAAIKEAIES